MVDLNSPKKSFWKIDLASRHTLSVNVRQPHGQFALAWRHSRVCSEHSLERVKTLFIRIMFASSIDFWPPSPHPVIYPPYTLAPLSHITPLFPHMDFSFGVSYFRGHILPAWERLDWVYDFNRQWHMFVITILKTTGCKAENTDLKEAYTSI